MIVHPRSYCVFTLPPSLTRSQIDNIKAARDKKVDAEWDTNTGLKKDHVHASSKIKAFQDTEMVTNLSKPFGPCDLTTEFRAIERRYSTWMRELNYDRDVLESTASLPRSTLPDHPKQVRTTRVLHIINYFGGDPNAARKGEQGLHSWEITLTQQSILTAYRWAKSRNIDPIIVAAVFEGEEASVGVLRENATICVLPAGKRRYFQGHSGPHIPYLQDILGCVDAVKGSIAATDPLVYTNADIGVAKDFYVKVTELMTAASTVTNSSFSITRRELFYNSSWPAMAATDPSTAVGDAQMAAGETHPGHDCFIMPSGLAPALRLGNLTIAFSPWGCALQALLNTHGPFRVLDKTGWTFHFGTVPALPDVSPYPWLNCSEIARHTGGTTCASKITQGMCCVSCDRPNRFASAAARGAEPTGDECDWHKSYNKARWGQTNDNWAATVENTMQTLQVIKNASPHTMQRCCAFAARGARALDRLNKHWSNRNDASGSCCINAGNPLWQQNAHEVLDAWCVGNVADEVAFVVPPDEADAEVARAVADIAKKIPGQAAHSRQKHMLLFHENLPSKNEGGDYRPYQLMEWLISNDYRVTVVTRTRHADDAAPNCHVVQATFGNATEETEYTRKNVVLKRSAQLFGVWKLSAMGVNVVEDDVCLSQTEAAFRGDGGSIPPLSEVSSIFATLWFYRQDAATGLSLASVPSLLLTMLKARKARGDPLPTFSVISDDIHYERAAMIAEARGDTADRATEIQVAEEKVYRDTAVDYLIAVTEEDAKSYQGLVGPAALRPLIKTLPFVGGKASPAPYNCSSAWWLERGITMASQIKREFKDREGLLYLGSGHYANILAVAWLLEQVMPMWAFMLDYRLKTGRLPSISKCPTNFTGVTISAAAQVSVPSLMIAGAPKWKEVRAASMKALPQFQQLYKKVKVPLGGFIPDLQQTLNARRLLLAPNLVHGSGVSTKIMTGLESGVPVVVNTWGANGYGCKDDRPGRLRCEHMLFTGPNQKAQREERNLDYEGYWFARGSIGLYTDKAYWGQMQEAGIMFARTERSLASWDPVLQEVTTGTNTIADPGTGTGGKPKRPSRAYPGRKRRTKKPT